MPVYQSVPPTPYILPALSVAAVWSNSVTRLKVKEELLPVIASQRKKIETSYYNGREIKQPLQGAIVIMLKA